MGIANHKNRCDFGALSIKLFLARCPLFRWNGTPEGTIGVCPSMRRAWHKRESSYEGRFFVYHVVWNLHIHKLKLDVFKNLQEDENELHRSRSDPNPDRCASLSTQLLEMIHEDGVLQDTGLHVTLPMHQKQTLSELHKGLPEGPFPLFFMCFFFSGRGLGVQVHSETFLHYLACPIEEACPDVPAQVFRPQSRNNGVSQFQTLAAAAGPRTRCNHRRRLPGFFFKGSPCWEFRGKIAMMPAMLSISGSLVPCVFDPFSYQSLPK